VLENLPVKDKSVVSILLRITGYIHHVPFVEAQDGECVVIVMAQAKR